MLQDKFVQKQHFKQAQVPVGDFLEVSNAQQAEQAGQEFGYPLMLKSRRFAYDGKGNAVVQSPEGLENAVQQLGGYKHGLYAEKWAVFVKVCLSFACLHACACLSFKLNFCTSEPFAVCRFCCPHCLQADKADTAQCHTRTNIIRQCTCCCHVHCIYSLTSTLNATLLQSHMQLF